MDSSKLIFKLFLENPDAVKPGEFVPVFHSLIQQKAVPDHLLIDVADYEHVPNTPDAIVGEFRTRFVEPKIFWHAQHHSQFANYLFQRHADGPDARYTRDTAAKLVEEANLFIDAAHQAHAKYRGSLSPVTVTAAPAAGPAAKAMAAAAAGGAGATAKQASDAIPAGAPDA